MTPIIWVVLVATVVVAIGIGAKLIAVRGARNAVVPVRHVSAECRISGHVYKEFDTGWRCAACGNHVARREGEQYGLVTDGKHERRREAR